MRSRVSPSLTSVLTFSLFGSFAVAAGLGCAGVKPVETGGNGGSRSGSGASGGSVSTGNGGSGPLVVTPISGSFTCNDFNTGCTFNGSKSTLDGNSSGSTTIAYPLDGSLFPSNLGPIQIQSTSGGTSARINFLTLQSGNVNINYYGACETGPTLPGSGCYVTLPVQLTEMLVPASSIENIQITMRVSNGGAPMESAPIQAAWAQTGVTGGLYYWTVIPNQPYCPSATAASPGTYCLEDTTQTPKNGTAIYRYDFSQSNPVPQQVWTDDGGPNSTPSYQGSPQAWDNKVAGGHCIGCHSITNDGKFMGLTIGGSSTYNAANWEVLDIQNQDLLLVNPTRTGGSGCNDPSATPTNDPTCYWQEYRKDAFATEMAWGPNDDVMVSMYMSKLYFNSVTVNGTTATIAQSGPALPSSATALDPYQSDPFWSHDGSLLVYTSFNTAAAANSTGNPGGLNGDLKTGGRIAIADATASSITDNAKELVPRISGKTSYYPCISEDSNYVVFNQSDCGGNPNGIDINYNGTVGYGTGVCDGYDDSSAKLYWVSNSGGPGVPLDAANGGSANYDNSWPRFSPDVGSFRGQTLYWVAFSSRRPYGTQVNTSGISSSQPQLWFTGVTSSEINVGDPSHAPVWLPGQNSIQQNPGGNATPYGNHVPQWVKVAIVIDKSL